MGNFIHKEMAKGKWFEKTLAFQLANVGSEVDRIISWRKKKNEKYAENAFYRALDLLDLTISDKRWHGAKLKELCRAR